MAKALQLRWREGSRVARGPQGSYHLFAHIICLANALCETLKERATYIQTSMITCLDIPPLRNEHSLFSELKPPMTS